MKKLLYISPFWPVKSGISEYSESLIWGLKCFFDITLLVDGYRLENREIAANFLTIHYEQGMDLSSYDVLLYNIGNNPDAHGYMYELINKYSGYVILHDVSLFYLTANYYSKMGMLYQKIYEMEGAKGIRYVKESLKKNQEPDLLLHKDIAADVLLNREIINRAKGIFVHSEYAAFQIARSVAQEKICKINLVESKIFSGLYGDFLRKKFRIPNNAKIIGAAGFIAPSKQNEISCKAIMEYNKTHKEKLHYVMIGEGNYVDGFLDKYIHKTGFLNNEDFYNALYCCDAILNLRSPYNGESSATLIQGMNMGKPCIVTDIGWFGEMPDDCVLKVKEQVSEKELALVFEQMLRYGTELAEKGKAYVKENCSPEKIADEIRLSIEEWEK